METTDFTKRQRDVIVELCKGRANKEIARTLGMAEATVKLHLTEIYRTCDVKTRSAAVLKLSGIAITEPEPVHTLSDTDILRDFTDTAMSSLNEIWSDRVLRFGYAVEKRINNK